MHNDDVKGGRQYRNTVWDMAEIRKAAGCQFSNPAGQLPPVMDNPIRQTKEPAPNSIVYLGTNWRWLDLRRKARDLLADRKRGVAMLMTLNDLRGCEIQATDGSIGKAKDFYFDDHSWSIRYLVVDTGWLFGRSVLTAPEAIETVDAESGKISISLNKKQLKDSPGIEADLPVSRQEEMKLREYYHWPSYWEGHPGGMMAAPLIPLLAEKQENEEANSSRAGTRTDSGSRIEGDDHLRSASEVQGYHIKAKDGEIGHVEDFVVDDEAWTIRYVVVDTRNWLPGRKVLLAPTWAEGISWGTLVLRVNLDREEIEKCPPYNPDGPIARDYEQTIHQHFARKPYWV